MDPAGHISCNSFPFKFPYPSQSDYKYSQQIFQEIFNAHTDREKTEKIIRLSRTHTAAGMEKKAPYFLVPYDSIKFLTLRNGVQFSSFSDTPVSAFDKNPFNDHIMLRVTLGLTLDTWKWDINFKGLKEIVEFCMKNMPKDDTSRTSGLSERSEGYWTLQSLQNLVDKVECIRTIHVMKRWDLLKTTQKGKEEVEVVDFEKFVKDIEEIKSHYVTETSV